MNLTVRMAGLDAVSLKVKYAIAAAQRGLKLSVPEAAQLIVDEAKTIVPVDTGNLRDHIHQEPLIDEPERQIAQVAPMVEADNKWGFDPAYARRIEYGFVGTDSLGLTYNQAAQPYMRPAFDAKAAEATLTIKEGIYSELDNAFNTVAQRRSGGRAKGQG